MRVLLLPSDSTGCGRQRMILPAEVLRAQGHDVVCEEENVSLWASMVQDDQGVEYVEDAGLDLDVDVVVTQRPCSRVMVDALSFLHDKGVRVVVELDDDLRCVPVGNVAYESVHPALYPERNWRHLERAISNADALVVTTPELARRYGRNLPTTVVPNYVPESYLTVKADKNGKTIGWPVNLASHPRDFSVTRAAVPQVIRQTGAQFRIVGPEVDVPMPTGTEWTGMMSAEDYPEAVARLDVGIAPLEDSRFNQSKSWLKPLELAALGVPFVMSPTDDYLRLYASYNMGWVARSPREWKARLTVLLTEEDRRILEAIHNRMKVVEHGLTIEERAEEFLAAWTGTG